MELEEILNMRFPHRNMQPSHDLSKESINEERKMAELITKLVEKGLDTNILLNDSAFRKLYETIKVVEQNKLEILMEEERIKAGQIGLNYKQASDFVQKHEDDPYEIEFEHSTSEITGYERNGEYSIPRTRDYLLKCSYSIGENGELAATYGLTELNGIKNETDLKKVGKRIIEITKRIGVKDGLALYSEAKHEENYVVGTGVKRINDSDKIWKMDEFDTTLDYTEEWKGNVVDLDEKIVEEYKPSKETITRNQDGVTATQCLADGTKKIVLLPSNELFLNYSNNTIINPTEEQIKQAQDELQQKVERSYGIKDYKNYESIAVVDGKAEKDRFGISYAGSEIKLLKTMDKTRELSEKAQQALNEKGVEPLKTDYFDLASDIDVSDKSETAEPEPLRTDYISDLVSDIDVSDKGETAEPEPLETDYFDLVSDIDVSDKSETAEPEPLRTDYISDLASDIDVSDKGETAEPEPLRTDYITDSPAVDDRQKKIGDIKAALQGLIKDGITLEDLQKELDELGREGNIEEEQNIE